MVLSVPRVAGLEAILTPALVVDLDAVRQNIAATLRLLGEDPNRWRPHLKTAKSIELQSLNATHPDRNLALKDVLWMARIVWASQ